MRFLLPAFLCALLLSVPAIAQTPPAKNRIYHEATSGFLLDYTTQNRVLDLSSDKNFLEYIRGKDCNLYKQIRDNQFQIQGLKENIISAINKLPPPPSIHVYVPASFLISNYNFNTQSLQLSNRSVIKRVGIMDLFSESLTTCGLGYLPSSYLPEQYVIRLMRPLSLMRIPMKQDVAKYVLQNMDQSSVDSSQKILYVTFNFTIEGMESKVNAPMVGLRRITMLGQLDSIDLFLDRERTLRVKHMDLEAFN